MKNPSHAATSPVRHNLSTQVAPAKTLFSSVLMSSGLWSLLGLVVMARGKTPDPIPNSAVKTLSADGTAA